MDISGTQIGANFAKNSLGKVSSAAVFMKRRVQKPYKAKCAKTVIAYKMKTVHDKDFLRALLRFNRPFSIHLVLCSLFTSLLYTLYFNTYNFLIFAYKGENNWRSTNEWRSENITKQQNNYIFIIITIKLKYFLINALQNHDN